MRLRIYRPHFPSFLKTLPRSWNLWKRLILVSSFCILHLGMSILLKTMNYGFLKLIVCPFFLSSFNASSKSSCSFASVSSTITESFFPLQIATFQHLKLPFCCLELQMLFASYHFEFTRRHVCIISLTRVKMEQFPKITSRYLRKSQYVCILRSFMHNHGITYISYIAKIFTISNKYW